MKKENRTAFLKKTAIVLCTLLFGAMSSCSSDDGGNPTIPGGDGKQYKFTITLNGVTSNDFISFVAVGSALSSPTESTIWKINGATQTNESAVSLDKNDFTGSTKTYVIESVTPLRMASVGMQFLASGDNTFTVNYKAEINGQVVKEDSNVTVTTTNDYTHNYSY